MSVVDYQLLCDEVKFNYLQNKSESPQNSCRIFHGRGKVFLGWEQVNIDFYEPVVHIIFYRDVEVNSSLLVEKLKSIMGEDRVYILQRRYLSMAPFEVLWGNVPENCYAMENSNKFELTFLKNQNIGFFLDMKLGRDLIKRNI